jgi:hypothetical protein
VPGAKRFFKRYLMEGKKSEGRRIKRKKLRGRQRKKETETDREV